jgi:hypothetical protein
MRSDVAARFDSVQHAVQHLVVTSVETVNLALPIITPSIGALRLD